MKNNIHNEDNLASKYVLNAKSEEEFLNAIYKEYLNRRPDNVGFNHYLKMLENGASRMQIISDISTSKESKKSPDSIIKKYKMVKQVCKIPVIGKFLFACIFLWNLEYFLREIRILYREVEKK